MRLLGVSVAEREAEDYYQLWRVVALLLGVRDELLPPDVYGARRSTERSHTPARHLRGSEHGRELMAALLTRMGQHVPRLKRAPRYLVRYLVGDAVAEHLGLPARSRVPSEARVPAPPAKHAARGRSARRATLRTAWRTTAARSVVLKKLEGAAASFAMPVRPPPRQNDG